MAPQASEDKVLAGTAMLAVLNQHEGYAGILAHEAWAHKARVPVQSVKRLARGRRANRWEWERLDFCIRNPGLAQVPEFDGPPIRAWGGKRA